MNEKLSKPDQINQPLAEMRESKFWQETVPGIDGWAYGEMIEMALQYDESLANMTEEEWRQRFE